MFGVWIATEKEPHTFGYDEASWNDTSGVQFEQTGEYPARPMIAVCRRQKDCECVEESKMPRKYVLVTMAFGIMVPVSLLYHLYQQGICIRWFYVTVVTIAYLIGCLILVLSDRACQKGGIDRKDNGR